MLAVGLALLAVATLSVAALAAAGIGPRVEMSDSMRPVLAAGDVVWVKRIVAANARAGDVIAFADPDHERVMMHRVERTDVGAGGRIRFVTKGDANSGDERWTIAAGGRVGRYVGLKVPSAGRVLFATAGAPLAVVAVLSGVALGSLLVRRIWVT